MSKKRGEGLKSFNKGFTVPDTYIIIFFVVVIGSGDDIPCAKGVLRDTGHHVHDEWSGKDPYGNQRRKFSVSDR